MATAQAATIPAPTTAESGPTTTTNPAAVEGASLYSTNLNDNDARSSLTAKTSFVDKLLAKGQPHHQRVPYLRKLPLPALAIILLLVLVNLIVWAAVGIVLHFNQSLISTAVLAYTLGLRHALDADHISAIDVMTRRLIAAGQRPVTVGTFFSLGHSTIVIVTCLVVAGTASAITSSFDVFGTTGGIIGTSVSAAFLLILGAMNVYILVRLVQRLRRLLRGAPSTIGDPTAHPLIPSEVASPHDDVHEPSLKDQGGPLFRLLHRLFRLIDRPWKMYPLGVLFGLGFDTSSEIALLGVAAVSAAQGTSLWLILIFPVLFTAGMCLLDTTDGALMSALYTSTALTRDELAIVYYQVVLTGVTVVVAIVVGTVQILNLVTNVTEVEGPFWDGVGVLGDHYDVFGGAICGLFVVAGVGAGVAYKPWRRWAKARIERRAGGEAVVMDRERELGNVTGKQGVQGGKQAVAQERPVEGSAGPSRAAGEQV